MTTPPDSLNPSSSPERREQTAAFLDQFWKGGEAVGKCGTGWYELALAAWLACCDWKDAWKTVATDGVPINGCPVIALIVNPLGETRRIRAMYAAEKTLPVSEEADDYEGVYDEATDAYYCAEGWYEANEYEDTYWRVSDEVTHWRPLPELPR